MRANHVFLSALMATAAVSVVAPVYGETGVFYDPSNPASPTGKTIGYELFRTIGCPGRELLGKPCDVPPGAVPPVASTTPEPATAAPTDSAATADSTAADRAALAAGSGAAGDAGSGAAAAASGSESAPPAAAALAADGQGSSGAPATDALVLEDVNFDFDKATLRPDAVSRLDVAADTLRSGGGSSGSTGGTSGSSGSAGVLEGTGSIEVAGHADSTGPEDYNMGLSLRRANAVRDYLVGQGIAPERLVVRGYGESQPTADNSTVEGRAKNRRVELLPQR